MSEYSLVHEVLPLGHRTFSLSGRPGRLLNVLYTFNIRPVFRG